MLRFFTADKLIESQLLNRMGAQVARTAAARWLYNLPSGRVDSSIQEIVDVLRRDGVAVIPDFLTLDHYEGVRQECLELLKKSNQVTKLVQGSTTKEMVPLMDHEVGELPHIDRFFADKRFHKVLEAIEKRPPGLRTGYHAVEHVVQGPLGEKDEETDMHSDVFYTSHKAWLYLNDVTPEDAPFAYVKGSHRMTPTQLRYIYKHSLAPRTSSRRITQAELDSFGWKETVLTARANTLVIGNVCGYHRRTRGEPGRERLAIVVSLRGQPFAWWVNRQ